MPGLVDDHPFSCLIARSKTIQDLSHPWRMRQWGDAGLRKQRQTKNRAQVSSRTVVGIEGGDIGACSIRRAFPFPAPDRRWRRCSLTGR